MSVRVPATSPATPKHQQLRDRLLAAIEAGRYRPGQLFPTEAEIAAAEGLSRNTVRQALADLERRGLIQRIRGKGTIVGGGPDAAAPTRLQDFVLIVPDVESGFYASLHKGFMDETRKAGRQVVVCDTNNDINLQANTFFQLMDRGIGGVALVPASAGAPAAHQVRQLQAAGVPVVLLHRPVEGVAAPLVGLNYDDVGYRAARRLIDAGHRRLACFYGYGDTAMHQYHAGIVRGLSEAGLRLNPDHEFVGRHPGLPFPQGLVSDLEAYLDRLLAESKDTRPTAVWCSYDPYAELIISMLNDRGATVPGDLSVLSLGGAWRGSVGAMRLDAITVDEAKGGQDAARLLAEIDRGERPVHDRAVVPLELGVHAGQTLRQID